MKLQMGFLTLTSLLLSGSIFAGIPRSVTIKGSAILTYPANTSAVCAAQLVKNGCTGEACTVGGGKTLTFDMGSNGKECPGISLTIQGGSGKCSNSQAELYLSPSGNTYDISLVNGFNTPVKITGGSTPISATDATANSLTNPSAGVYPYGCSTCTARTSADCGYKQYGKSLTKGCSGTSNCQITNDNSSSYTVAFG